MDDDGNVYTAWLEDRGDGNDCFVAASEDGGDTWNEDVRVDGLPNSPRSIPTTCDVGVDGDGNVYATYAQNTVQGWRVKFARSNDGGQDFTKQSNVYDEGGLDDDQEHPAMAISSRGSLYIVFLVDSPDSDRLFMIRSDDGINPLSPRAVEPGQAVDVAHVQGDVAVGSDGTVYVAYGYRASGEAGIKLATMPSTSGTFTVTKVYTVEEPLRFLRPRVAVSGDDEVEIIFDPLDKTERLVHIRSDDGGLTFGIPSVIWAAGEPGDVQTNPDIAFDSLGRVHIAWAQGGIRPTRALHSLSLDFFNDTATTEIGGAWNSSEMGAREWENHPTILPMADGGLAAAFTAKLNHSVGVYFSRLDNQAPQVTISYPSDGGEVRGLIPIQGTAQDPAGTTGLASIFVQVGDGEPVRLKGTTSWQREFDSTTLPDGWVDISAWASDGFLDGPVTTISVHLDNNEVPMFTIGTAASGTTHVGTVRVAGTANDSEGFDEGWTVQYSLDGVNWTDVTGGILLDQWNLDYEIELNLGDYRSGAVDIHVRASDGDKFSEPKTVNVIMDNRPDLHISLGSISWVPDEPKHGETVSITITVENRGVSTSERYELSVARGAQVVGLATGSNLPPGEEENLLVQWDAKGGDNSLKVTVDSKGLLDELNEDDNEVLFTVKVKRPPSDDGDSGDLGYLWVIVIVGGILGVVVTAKYWMMTRPEMKPEVETVYEGGGMYDDVSGPYSGTPSDQAPEGAVDYGPGDHEMAGTVPGDAVSGTDLTTPEEVVDADLQSPDSQGGDVMDEDIKVEPEKDTLE
jgi:hypothetical protein